MSVDRQAAVEIVPRVSNQPHSKLSLEHYNSTAECWTVGEKLESEGGRNLIWNVGNTNVKIGEVTLEDISLNDL